MLKFIIIDDEVNHAISLKERLVEEFKEAASVDIFEAYHEDILDYDIYFLDIDMPGVDGITIAKKLKDENSKRIIVFVSFRDDLVFESMEATPFYFVRKTNFEMDFAVAIKSIKRIINEDILFIETMMNMLKLKVRMNDILFIEKLHNYIGIHTQLTLYKVREPISKYYTTLPNTMFGIINQSFIVHLGHVKYVTPEHVVLRDDKMVYFSRGRFKVFKVLYVRYLEDHRL